MNVWYIHPYAGGPGVGRYWRPYYFSKFWNKAGHTSVVISAAYHHLLEPDEVRKGTLEIKGVRYAYVPTLKYQGNGMGRMMSMLMFSLLLLPFCLLRGCRHGRPNVIIYSSPHPFGALSAWLAARLLGAQFVFEVRDIWPLSLVELGGLKENNPMVRLTGWIERFAYKRSNKVISLLPCAEAHMSEKGLAPGKFLWVPNGVDLGEGLPENKPAESSFAQHVSSLKDQGYFVVIYAGAHGDPNALSGLVHSALILQEQSLNIKIILVGKGERKAQLMGYAGDNSLEMVEFFDQQPKESVLEALSLASAGYISLKSQPIFRFGVSPNKLWDYMLTKLPVIFACKSGNDPVGDYGCGVTADPECPRDIARAIRQLYEMSDVERVAMGQRGHDAVLKHYTYEQLAGRVVRAVGSTSFE
ncbi:MAG: glycosyltransferase family 4 protein [Pseudomonas sp.]|uniref:glycosyltransferase family 4 protein n=1 Tax=Pseudomonas sp. TaxID=306 RepID=UPI002FCC6760